MSDPYLQREQMRYKHPIASREFILNLLEESRKPMRLSQIKKLSSTPDDQLDALKKRLGAMVRDGQIQVTAKSCYLPLAKIVKNQGVVQRLRDGNVELVQQDETMISVPGIDASLLLTGDVVTYRKVKVGQRTHAVVIDIIKREHQYLLGMIEEIGNQSYFICLQRGLPRMKIKAIECEVSDYLQIVKAKIKVSARTWSVIITEVVGHSLDPHIPEVIAQHISVLTKVMPEEVKEQIANISKLTNKADDKRVDWSHLPLVTIDGETARDFDDAVMAEVNPKGGWNIYVAIADVAHYVPVDSPLDHYAYEQTTSIYFPKQCVPMLPEILSNDLCSLLPNTPRLAIGVQIHIDKDGEIVDGNVQRVIIHSKARMTYESVENMLDGTLATPSWFAHSLASMKEATLALQALSARRRALNILSKQESIAFDEKGAWDTMSSKDAYFSHGLIEKMMVTANHFIARFLKGEGVESIYRHHPSVRAEGFEALLRELKHAGIESNEGHDLYSLNEQIRKHSKYKWLAPWVVRAMSQARYEPSLTDHWGLSLDAYVHFTSPIRRYPDLMIHRALGALIDGVKKPKLSPAPIECAARRCSRLERRADASVYDAIDWYQCQWVYRHLQESLEGSILSMLAFGVFVRLSDSLVEVLLPAHHLESLGYRFDHMQSQWTHPTFDYIQLGQKVTVRLVQVSFSMRRRDAIWEDAPKYGY